MYKKHLIEFLFVSSFIVFGMTFVRATIYAPTDNQYAPTATTAVAHAAEQIVATSSTDIAMTPVRLFISSIGVDAKVQPVGLTAKGNMGVPSNFTDVAWYKYGPTPGTPGSSVIDGHVDNGLSLPGVFKHLGQVKVGDDIFVETQSDKRLHFVVQKTKTYPYYAVPQGLLFEKTDAAHLNLITCTGTWLPTGKTYDTRLVVYAVLAS